ncbi:ABC transporter G family member 23 [Mercurialis annua]|uniref:ABC transporter G family member 23 n=1 Tax=Mercurialis annua TaxID=3986 RepID=UPI00215F5BF8|nr:ABC transporter G family member 23 [Mercurialis annua]
MASCFTKQGIEEDSIILFSTSSDHSHEESASSSSSSPHSPPPPSPPSPPPPSHHSQISYRLTVTNLSYTISPSNSMSSSFFHFLQNPNPINILHSVSFQAISSEILAIVGPSGTGKSSLLRFISGRVKDKDFTPKSISINDRYISNPSHLRKICGFVAQEDNLLPLLTVQETLMYSAKFRLKGLSMSSKDREKLVESLMMELKLSHVAHSFVGDEEKRGISGGERKRVSIGVEMIHNPAILILDEPTSGLDSSSAFQVIDLLSTMAKEKSRTIVLSIHQPSYRILRFIHKFLILSHGSVVHNGSLDSLEQTISNLGFQIPIQLNPLEFAMEIIHTLEDSSTHMITCPFENNNDESFGDQFNYEDIKKKGIFYDYFNLFEIIYLCSRFWKVIYRTKQLFLARTMQAIVGGLGLGSVYIKVRKDEGGITERLGFFAFSLSFLLSSTVEALPIYLQERKILMKESSRGAYKISSYMIANTIIFIPFLFAVAILFSVPVYWLVGLNPSISAFIFFNFIVWLIILMASSLVLFLSAISPDFISGNSLISTILGAFFLFSGYFIPKENIPKYWMFMYYVSIYRYPLDCLLINEYWSMRSECFSWKNDECLISGDDVLKSRGLDKDIRWINVGIMLGFFVFYRLLCWIILARRASKSTI